MHDDVKRALAWCATGAVTLLLSGNIFFLKHTFDKIENLEQVVWQLRQDSVILKFTIEEIKNSTKRGR